MFGAAVAACLVLQPEQDPPLPRPSNLSSDKRARPPSDSGCLPPQVRRSLALTVTALALKLGGVMHRGGPPDAETETHILRCKVVPLVQRAAEDPAWQVRDPLDPAWQVIRRSVGSR